MNFEVQGQLRLVRQKLQVARKRSFSIDSLQNVRERLKMLGDKIAQEKVALEKKQGKEAKATISGKNSKADKKVRIKNGCTR